MAVTEIRRSTQIKATNGFRVVVNDTTGHITDNAALTAARALQSDLNGLLEVSVTTAAELAFLSGVTSSVQTQLNGKASLALDNLASVAINTSLLAGLDNTIDLGSDSKEWRDAWMFNIKHNDATTPTLSIATTGNNGNIKLAPHGTGSIDASSSKIINLANPVNPQDAATKFYVDSAASGLDVKQSVRVATNATLPAVTPAGSGVGKTLTANANGALVVDGVTVAVSDRILVKDQVATLNNGIYTVTATGDGSNPFVLTRATDFDQNAEVTADAFTFIEEGSAWADTGWILVTNNPIVVDTTALTFTQFSSAGVITAGAGLTQTGNSFDVVSANTGITVQADSITLNLNAVSGLEISSGLRVKTDTVTANTIGVSITTDGSGVKFDSASFTDSGSETLALAAGVAGNGLALTSGVLSVNVDNSTLEINSDSLRVKASGITANELASNAVTFVKTFQVVRQVPAGTIDGVNSSFTPGSLFVNGSEMVFLNGILQNAGGNDYTGNGTTIVFTSAPLAGDILLVSYWRA